MNFVPSEGEVLNTPFMIKLLDGVMEGKTIEVKNELIIQIFWVYVGYVKDDLHVDLTDWEFLGIDLRTEIDRVIEKTGFDKNNIDGVLEWMKTAKRLD